MALNHLESQYLGEFRDMREEESFCLGLRGFSAPVYPLVAVGRCEVKIGFISNQKNQHAVVKILDLQVRELRF